MINEYVDRLYRTADPELPETKELKDETRQHLEETVSELISDGYAQQLAMKIAIERFGGEEQSQALIQELQLVQKLFAKRILRAGMIMLVLSLMCGISGFVVRSMTDMNQQNILYQLEDEWRTADTATLKNIVQQNKMVTSARISSLSETRITLEQSYQQYFPPLLAPFLTTKMTAAPDEGWQVELDVIDTVVIGLALALIGLSAAHVLFAIWIIIQRHRTDRLSRMTTVLSVVIPALSILLYYVTKKRL
ncbi:permease prefix domain 1-containing protein [Exiguobacterium sp. s133]|uniref:permease prefix domain 1-containing protein n=1 Tax=Exiguobacterium sp. s133 TaxID=2751213 RepID=UPI001BEB72CA|nr:permease prefix domain 1-containing protein [Exiguobacterium sp. s133]